MTDDLTPDPLPCRCKHGHAYTRSEAEELNNICDVDGSAIECAEAAKPEARAKKIPKDKG